MKKRLENLLKTSHGSLFLEMVQAFGQLKTKVRQKLGKIISAVIFGKLLNFPEILS